MGDREVIGRDDGREPLSTVLWRRLRARPRVLAALAAVALVATGAAAAIWVVPAVRGPVPPPLTVRSDPSSPTRLGAWRKADDGHAAGLVDITFLAWVGQSRPDVRVSVLGVAGPGVRPAGEQPSGEVTALPVTGGERFVTLPASIDCAALPPVLPRGAYGLRVSATKGFRSTTAAVGAGAVGEQWGSVVASACSVWLARRSLTITDVAATVHPTLPRTDLRLTLRNSGPRPVTVRGSGPGRWYSDYRQNDLTPVTVPAGGTATTSLTVTLRRCDFVPGLDGSQPSRPILTDLIGLDSSADLRPAPGSAAIDYSGGGPEVVRIIGGGGGIWLDAGGTDAIDFAGAAVLVSPAAATVLAGALHRACGELGALVAAVGPGGVRYDRARQELTVPVTITVTPGAARSVTLTTRTGPGAGPGRFPDGVYQPLTPTVPDLVPDRTGQARTVLRYRASPDRVCPEQGGTLPEILATVRVPSAAGERVVALSVYLSLEQDPNALSLLCP